MLWSVCGETQSLCCLYKNPSEAKWCSSGRSKRILLRSKVSQNLCRRLVCIYALCDHSHWWQWLAMCKQKENPTLKNRLFLHQGAVWDENFQNFWKNVIGLLNSHLPGSKVVHLGETLGEHSALIPGGYTQHQERHWRLLREVTQMSDWGLEGHHVCVSIPTPTLPPTTA